MTRQKEVQDFYREEYERVERENGSSFSILDIINDMNINDLTQEDMRLLGPVGTSTRREATRNFKICDVKIKKGDLMITGLSARTRSKKLFKNAGEFQRERMTTQNKTKYSRLDVIPFGFGYRVCIG